MRPRIERYSRQSKIGLLEYFFDTEIVTKHRQQLRAFFRLPGMILPSAEMDAEAQHPGWFAGALCCSEGMGGTKKDVDYFILYFLSCLCKADEAVWAAFFPINQASCVRFAIDTTPEIEALYKNFDRVCEMKEQ